MDFFSRWSKNLYDEQKKALKCVIQNSSSILFKSPPVRFRHVNYSFRLIRKRARVDLSIWFVVPGRSTFYLIKKSLIFKKRLYSNARLLRYDISCSPMTGANALPHKRTIKKWYSRPTKFNSGFRRMRSTVRIDRTDLQIEIKFLASSRWDVLKRNSLHTRRYSHFSHCSPCSIISIIFTEKLPKECRGK